MSLVNSCVFLIGGEKCFLFDQLIGNYHETCVQCNIQHSNFKLRYKQDSKESSPRLLDKMLLKLQVNAQNVESTQLSKFFKFSKSELL